MATALPTTGVGNSAAPNEWDSAPNGALTLIGDSNQDTNFGFVNTNATGTYVQGYRFNGVPADFVSMSNLSIQLRYAWGATPTNSTWNTLSARIIAPGFPGDFPLAASTSGGAFQSVDTNITTTTPTNSSVISFDFVGNPLGKAGWDDGVVEILIERTRIKGGGTEEQRVFAVSITGEYVALDTTTKYFFIT